jgi:hypothetical protein
MTLALELIVVAFLLLLIGVVGAVWRELRRLNRNAENHGWPSTRRITVSPTSAGIGSATLWKIIWPERTVGACASVKSGLHDQKVWTRIFQGRLSFKKTPAF